MDTIDDRNAVVQPLSRFWYGNKVAAMDMLRLDLLHPIVSGNKWYKLRLNVDAARDMGYKTILTFGGGYSNHLVATAYAARMFGLGAIAIVRGRYDVLTPTLQDCIAYGMQLIFVTQEDYKNKDQPDWLRTLVDHFDELFIVPEGGANERGRTGAGLISWYIDAGYTHIVTAVGSGTTLAGLRARLPVSQYMLGFAPMKQGQYLKDHINAHLPDDKKDAWSLFDKWHCGGFGKWNTALTAFMNEFYKANHIPLDIVYTGKMMLGMQELLDDNFFSVSDRILCIHSGGLQGNVSARSSLIY
jgi:1-aminocyclopropane-1-carboxylate deaminase